MYAYLKKRGSMKALLIIACSAIVMISLCGFRDIISIRKKIMQEGDQCNFEARIVETESHKGGNTLVVEKKPVKEAIDKRIYVLVTGDTTIGYQKNSIKFKDLKVGMSIEIEGLKIVEKTSDQEMIVVYAKSITPIVE